MRNNKLIIIILTIVLGIILVACSPEEQQALTKDGHITIQTITYETESGAMFWEEESLGIDHFEVNGNTFRRPPYTIYNLPGNQNYSYTMKAYDAEGIVMASASGQWMVVEGFATPVMVSLVVKHQHTFRDTWSSDESYHWHASSCGHSAVGNKEQHTFDGDVCTVCGYDKHVHTYSSSWSSNDYSHWHAATCGHDVRGNEAQHTFGSETVVTAPTCAKAGTGSHTCMVCGKTVTYSIPKIQHNPDENHLCTVCGAFVPYIGPAGGYVFYDKGSYSDGWRYLEAAPADLRVVDGVPTVDKTASGYSNGKYRFVFGFYRTADDGSNLYVNGTTTHNASDCTGTAIGTGKTNTQLLVNAMGAETYSSYSSKSGSSKTANYAAKLCDDLTYTVNGVTYDDWFLPSKDELNQMYVNLKQEGLGGFDYYCYWSSSERSKYSAGSAWEQDFNNGSQDYYNRDHGSGVRPVRAF